jgi:hypothetical protein
MCEGVAVDTLDPLALSPTATLLLYGEAIPALRSEARCKHLVTTCSR